MKSIADLHVHSTASDGQYDPAELVRLAKKRGIEVMSLTDHDTTDGLDEAVEAGRTMGVQVLRGIELSADEYPNLHILGYGVSAADPGLCEMCGTFKQGRERRKFRIAAFLQEKGVDIPLAEVEALAQDGRIGRPHFAQVMLRHGYAATREEAFDRYLDTDEFHRMDGGRPSAKTCIEIIRNAGGTASLAHPYQTGLAGENLERLIQELADCGLGAIECFYPAYTEEQTAYYLRMAEQYHLHITGGSDFHGERVKPGVELAAWELDLGWLLEK